MNIKSSKTLVNEALNHIETLEPNDALKLNDDDSCTLVDIRDIRELWNDGAIKNAIHIPRGMLEFWLDPNSPYFKKEKFSTDKKKLVLFCAGGLRSALATKTLKDMGYENVSHISGGFGAMKISGFSVIEKKKE